MELGKAKDVARELGLSVATVYSLRCRGVFPRNMCLPRGFYNIRKLRYLIDRGLVFNGNPVCETNVVHESILPTYGSLAPTTLEVTNEFAS
jgi:hypothetical protein